jgi:hypothetical protein
VSDAAPLPRLGEVFFDVRGNSRSMRLSWYADTGVAVFSIWQAGMCTGTFRLPIGDLRRMIEILERGPAPQGQRRAPVSAARRGPDRGREEYPASEDEIGLLDSAGGPDGYAGAAYTADYGRSGQGTGQHAHTDGGTADYPAADYGSASYGDPGYEQGSYGDPAYEQASYADSGHNGGSNYGYGGPDQHGDHHDAGRGTESYGQDGYSPDGGFGAPDRHRGTDYGSAGYQPADYGAGQPAGHESGTYEQHEAGYGRGGYADEAAARRSGRPDSDYAPGSYGAAAPDYLTGEHPAPGYHDGMRADTGSDYGPGGYGSQPAFPASGRRRDDSRFAPDTGGLPHGETDGTGYSEERFVPPYVGGGGDAYPNDNRAGAAGYEGDLDDPGYPAGAPSNSPSDRYHETQWPGESYSYGSEYRRR